MPKCGECKGFEPRHVEGAKHPFGMWEIRFEGDEFRVAIKCDRIERTLTVYDAPACSDFVPKEASDER